MNSHMTQSMKLDTNTSQVHLLIRVQQQRSWNRFTGLKNLSVFGKDDSKEMCHVLSPFLELFVQSALSYIDKTTHVFIVSTRQDGRYTENVNLLRDF